MAARPTTAVAAPLAPPSGGAGDAGTGPWIWVPSLGEWFYLDKIRRCYIGESGREVAVSQMVHFQRIDATSSRSQDVRRQPNSDPFSSDRYATRPKATSTDAPSGPPPPPPPPFGEEGPPQTSAAERKCPSGRIIKGLGAIEWEEWSPGQPLQKYQTILIEEDDEPPVTVIRHIAQGGCAWVDEVKFDGTEEVCVLKTYVSKDASEDTRQAFEREINNMRKVQHLHVAAFYAAYVHEKASEALEYGILMQPVAEGTLQGLLMNRRRWRSKVDPKVEEILTTSFGCLACVVHFLQSAKMRHKDLKPSNILVHHGRIFLTDFGSSFDGSAAQRMTTSTGNPEGFTRRYAAPEFITGHPRNEKSDIFAMGAVFYETLSVMVADLPYFEAHYYEKLTEIRNSLRTSANSRRSDDPWSLLMTAIGQMLDPRPASRPSADRVVVQLPRVFFCPTCKLGPVSSNSESSAKQTPLDTARLKRIFESLESRVEENPMHAGTIVQIFEALQKVALSSGLPGLSKPNADQCKALAQSPEARKTWLSRIHQAWLKTISVRGGGRGGAVIGEAGSKVESSDEEDDSDEAEYSDVASDVE